LAINLAIKKKGLLEYIRFLKLIYTAIELISGLLRKKASTLMLVPFFNDTLIRIAREYNTAIIEVNQAEQ